MSAGAEGVAWYMPKDWHGLNRILATRGAMELLLPRVIPPTIRAQYEADRK